MEPLLDTLRRARRASVPIVSISTRDETATARSIATLETVAPVLGWDPLRGLYPLTDPAAEWLKTIGQPAEVRDATATLAQALEVAASGLPEASILCATLAGRQLVSPDADKILAALRIIRDGFKANGRLCALLGSALDLPADLAGDVVALEDGTPTQKEHADAALRLAAEATPPAPCDQETAARAGDALRGLTAFAAEQAIALSLRKAGPDLAELWERKRSTINQTPGLTMEDSRNLPSFADLAGLAQIVAYHRRLLSGPRRPKVVVLIDEIEKDLAGSQGDTSGTSQYALKALLDSITANDWRGTLCHGVPGTGKTLFARALAREAGGAFVVLDLGSTKGSLVGESERQIRNALRTLYDLSGSDCYIIGTCNAMTLPSALLRRMDPVWFFDLTDAQERAQAWTIHAARVGHADDPRPNDDGWTAANVSRCCDRAYDLNTTLQDAAQFIQPYAVAQRQQLADMRAEANGQLLSASYPGPYQTHRETAKARAVQIES